MIQRYEPGMCRDPEGWQDDTYGTMEEDPRGGYVSYSDHLADIARLREIEAAAAELLKALEWAGSLSAPVLTQAQAELERLVNEKETTNA